MAQETLSKAKNKRYDEYYTRMVDIENELSQYDFKLFKDKVIYCNCDDPTWSNFFKFFIKWGKRLGIKEARFTNYANKKRQFKPLTLFETDDLKDSVKDDKKGIAHFWVYKPSTDKIIKKELKGDGDFRSDECINFLEQADIIVTNPPFSLFKEYLEQLVEYNKKFLILGNPNAITYKEMFKLIRDDKVWLGYKSLGTDTYFKITAEHREKLLRDNKEGSGYVIRDGEVLGRTMACWYTNLDLIKRHNPMVLHHQDLSQFCKYDNYDALEIPKVKMIPDNYYGVMGVPITFLDKYCPEQFEIIGTADSKENLPGMNQLGKAFIDGYRAQGGTGHYSVKMYGVSLIQDGKYKIVFKRIFIKRRKA